MTDYRLTLTCSKCGTQFPEGEGWDDTTCLDCHETHTVTIAWGELLEDDDPDKVVETYTFNTRAELDAFMLGITEAEGWFGYQIKHDSREDN